MTNVSASKVNSKDYEVIYQELTSLITKLNKKTAPYLLDNLLTETEQIMIVKRFGAICMFSQQFTPYRVSQTLGISEPTASRIFEQYSSKRFDELLTCIKKKESSQFFSLIEDLIAAQANSQARTRLFNRAQRFKN